ncbi:MAG: CotH kinase family protein [Ignavibacteria bacterium]|nr:CotH kinase family protein [Ignavibacteria bacterium]
MLKVLLIAGLFYVSSSILIPESALPADGDSVFAGVQVHNINIIFSQPNYWDSLIFYYNEGLEHFMSATVIVNGQTLSNTGVRLKGNSSFTHPNNKKSFRLSFNEFVSGQRWNGLRGVHLNNCWNDPTFMREKLQLDYCNELGLVAPRCNYVRLSINDTLFALYSLVEHINNSFYTSRYGTSEGEQFKAVDAVGTSNDIFSDFRWLGSDSSAYFDHYELKSNLTATTWPRLISLIDSLNHSGNVASSLPDKVNLTPYYKAMAVDNLMGNMDSYVYTGRNFYIFFPPPSNKMEWVIWDVGLSFGALPGGPSSIETLPVTYVTSDTARPLFSKIINDPVLKTNYLNAYCNIFLYNFSTSVLYPKIDSIANVIRSYVYEDPRKMYSNAQFETNIISDIIVSGSRKPGLKSYIQLRRSSVQSQLNALGINCDVSISNETGNIKSFELSQNYPNPFNPTTQIEYSLYQPGNVNLKIYNNLGKEVASLVNNLYQTSGSYILQWNGNDNSGAAVPTGMYFYKLETGNNSVTKKMLLLK